MNEKKYRDTLKWINERPGIRSACIWLTRLIPVCYGIVYAVFLVITALVDPLWLISLAGRPLLCFIAVTIIRDLINRPRPYDVYHFESIVDYKPGKGKSFPSRHTASAAVITLCICQMQPVIGGILVAAAIVLSLLRVVCGAHFIKDIVAGWAFAIAFAFI